MTLREFLTCMAALESGTGRTIDKRQADVWFGVMRDLPIESLQSAIARFLAEDSSGWLPAIGKLRQLAVEARDGRNLDAGEAWEIVCRTVGRISPYYEPERFLAALPETVRVAVVRFGLHRLTDGDDNASAMHAQFRDVYQSVADREGQSRLLPAAVVPRLRDSRGPSKIGIELAGLIGHVPPQSKQHG